MEQMDGAYYVNPAVKLNVAADGILQFRFPDSRHVTIECPAIEIATALNKPGAAPVSEWMDKFANLSVTLAPEIAQELFGTLRQVCVLIPDSYQSDTRGRAIYMHEHLVTRAAKGSFEVPTFATVSVTGEAVLSDVISEVLEEMSVPQASSDVADAKIVTSDRPDFPSLRNVYRAVGDAQFKSCIWFDDGSLRLGPLHVREESACLECFISRCEATAHFFEEAVAFHNTPYLSVNEKPLGHMERNLALFAVERYLRLIQQGQFDQIEPGHVESWSLLTGEKEILPVLRNPYCKCVPASAKPSRAVRDII